MATVGSESSGGALSKGVCRWKQALIGGAPSCARTVALPLGPQPPWELEQNAGGGYVSAQADLFSSSCFSVLTDL